MTVVAVVLVIAIALALDWETPYRAAAKAAKPIESRVHFGKDEDQRGSPGSARSHPGLAGRAGQEARRPPGPLIGGWRAAPRSWPAPPSTPGPRSPRSCPRSAGRSGSSCARTIPTASPSPSTTVPTRRGPPRCSRRCARPGAPATFFLAGEQVAPRPSLAAEIVAAGHRVELHCFRHRNQLRLTPRQLIDDAERCRAAIEEATGQAVHDYRPPYGIFSGAGLRAVRAPRLAAGPLVAVGEGLGQGRERRVDRAPVDRRRERRGRAAPPRRRLLQRAGLVGPNRRGAAADHRRARPQGPARGRAPSLRLLRLRAARAGARRRRGRSSASDRRARAPGPGSARRRDGGAAVHSSHPANASSRRLAIVLRGRSWSKISSDMALRPLCGGRHKGCILGQTKKTARRRRPRSLRFLC